LHLIEIKSIISSWPHVPKRKKATSLKQNNHQRSFANWIVDLICTQLSRFR